MNNFLRIVTRPELVHVEKAKPPSPPPPPPPKRIEPARNGFLALSPVKAGAWKQDPIVKNPVWYGTATASANKTQAEQWKIAVLTSVNIHHDRSLVRAFEAMGIALLDRDGTIQGADMVLSATTAVLFRSLAKLPDEAQAILDTLRTVKQYYDKILLVFEVEQYKQKEEVGRQADTTPLNNEVNRALPAFRRSVAITLTNDDEKSGGSVNLEILMAKNGATEVEVLRWVMEQEFELLRRSIGDVAAIELCEDRQWLHEDDVSLSFHGRGAS